MTVWVGLMPTGIDWFFEKRYKKQQNYSQTPNVNWGGVGLVGFLAGMLWLGAKIAAAPYTGGLSLALP